MYNFKKKVIVNIFALVILHYLFVFCNSVEKPQLFFNYKLSDTLVNGGFYFERNNTIYYENKKFYKFKLTLIGGHTEFLGYIGSKEDSVFLYYPELGHSSNFVSFTNIKKIACDSITVVYNIKIDSTYERKKTLQVCSNGYFTTNHDTVYKFSIQKFSLLMKEDNLGLYISRSKGIVGWTSQLSDGGIISYGGNIYSDTLNTIEHQKRVIQ